LKHVSLAGIIEVRQPMTKELNIQTIRQAQAGNKQSLSAVAEQVRQKAYTYIYRLTLDYHLTEDLTQETVLEMIKSLPQLEVPHVNGFWGWIFRTALGKVQHHFRLQGARRLARKTTSDDYVLESQASDDNNPMNALVSEEIRKAVLGAMQAITIKYRNILVLRCFENLSYGQIAGITGGSELKTRLLFFRAKHSLKNQLERNGFKRDHLLAVLTMFAGLTLGTGKKAAAGEVVLASSLETGLGISLASLMTAKTAIAAACILIIAGFTASMIRPEPSNTTVQTTSEELYSHLYPLLDNEEFVAPSQVVDVNDPDNDGFMFVNLNTPTAPAQRLKPDNLGDFLLNKPNMGLVLPKDHWAELGFDGPLNDGPGPDLLIITRGCRSYTRVFVTDGLGKVFELPQPQCWRMGVCRNKHIIDFDLATLNLPFEPHAVRLMGNSNRGRVGGVEFYSVRARIQRTEP
jgi:RNA polymerase sigma-70 factor (ECF subfamily)